MLEPLTVAYQHQLKVTRGAVGDAVANQWRRLGSYNEADVPRFVANVTPIVAAGQSRAVALTSAYLSRKLGQPPMGLTLDGLPPIRKGVPLDVVYRRPFVRVWSSLKDEGDYDYAVQLGEDQAKSNSLMDVALATMASYVGFAMLSAANSTPDTKSEIVAWVRRADPGCCDFCQMIDGAHTGPDEPQPLHNRCGCTADPVTREVAADATFLSPGSTLDDVAIHEHGELGPVITQKGDNFTGPADIPDGEE